MSDVFIPYVGLGLGALYAKPAIYFNIYAIEEDSWGFLARPEIGGIIKLGHDGMWGILVGVDYSLSTNKEEIFKIDNMQSFGVTAGFSFLY